MTGLGPDRAECPGVAVCHGPAGAEAAAHLGPVGEAVRPGLLGVARGVDRHGVVLPGAGVPGQAGAVPCRPGARCHLWVGGKRRRDINVQ